MSSRRQFISGTVGAIMSAEFAPRFAQARSTGAAGSAKSLRILFLGGTGFIGPHHVRAAVERGHKVSVFNRGKSEADLPAAVERLVGDRNADLGAIKNRDWDAVVDLQTYSPRWVRSLGQALKGRVNHYTFISTVMAYARNNGVVDEASPLMQLAGDVDPFRTQPSGWQQYGSFKVTCEREAEAQFPRKTLVVRPGVISGPGDHTDHLAYWLARMRKGGEILAPGDPLAPLQYIDARDLADWVIRMIEEAETGTYNAVGPAMSMGMSELLGAVRSMFATPMRLTWVPSQWLIEHGVKADGTKGAPFFWTKSPNLAEPDELWLSYQVSSQRAVSKGLTFRSVATTLQDNLSWYTTLPAERQAMPFSGWAPEYEQRLLTAWHDHQAKAHE